MKLQQDAGCSYFWGFSPLYIRRTERSISDGERYWGRMFSWGKASMTIFLRWRMRRVWFAHGQGNYVFWGNGLKRGDKAVPPPREIIGATGVKGENKMFPANGLGVTYELKRKIPSDHRHESFPWPGSRKSRGREGRRGMGDGVWSFVSCYSNVLLAST